jgi:adenylate kinase
LAEQNKNIVLAGSPRTLHEGKKIMPFIIDLYRIENILVLELKISDKQAIWRNTRRKLCSKCRYPVPFTKETQKLKECPKCGGKLVTRTLDAKDVIKIRLKQYKGRTYPLFKYFKEIGVIIEEINGEQSIEDVFKDILKAMER